MLYPKNIELKLGFDQIREMVRKECLSSLGQSFVDKIQFSNDFATVEKLLNQAGEFIRILQEGLNFPVQNYLDVFPLFDKIRPVGSFLSSEEFRVLKVSLQTIFSCVSFLEKHAASFPNLAHLKGGVSIDKGLVKEVDRVIEDNGTVRSNASRELQEIRQKLLAEQGRIRKELEKILNQAKKQGFTDEDLSATIRGGRMVIPVRAEFKRSIKGFIHDESSTGQTVFIEPAEVLEINNTVKELEYAERREIVKILTALTEKIRPFLPELKKAYIFLGILDFIRAKALVSLKLQAIRPELSNSTYLKLRDGRHPLLFLSHQKQQKSVVPLNLDLSFQQRIIIISGPNAGGKSVALKCVGLIQYMLQCGFPVPVGEGSVMGIFNDIFIDIGDEQSVENDLSTYSSHLRNMKYFLDFAENKSMILIDEFGTGTEPHFGGAIAEAVLERLNEKKVFGIVTTHFSNLKAFADVNQEVTNAAMLFDMKKLEPMYVLETGRPGSSFAIEIARKTGLSKEVIESAKLKTGEERVDYDRLIRELEVEKSKLRKQVDQYRQKQKALDEQQSRLKEQNEFLETHKRKLMNEAKLKAKSLLEEANQKIEETIREIKEHQADKEKTRQLRKNLESYDQKLKPEFIKEAEPEVEVEEGEIREGDTVRIKGQNAFAEVIALKGNEAELLIGELKSKAKLNRLEKVSRREYRKHVGELSRSGSASTLNLSEKFSEFTSSIDVRGMRAEEALPLVDSLIDNAILFNVPEVRIVHGKGNGILRTVIRDHLKKFSQVKSAEDEHADRGGAGVSIIRLQ